MYQGTRFDSTGNTQLSSCVKIQYTGGRSKDKANKKNTETMSRPWKEFKIVSSLPRSSPPGLWSFCLETGFKKGTMSSGRELSQEILNHTKLWDQIVCIWLLAHITVRLLHTISKRKESGEVVIAGERQVHIHHKISVIWGTTIWSATI